METTTSTITYSEGQSSNRPPCFNGSNYAYWKNRMRIYMIAQDFDLWQLVVNGPHIPIKIVDNVEIEKTVEEYNDIDKRLIKMNANAMNILYCGLDPNEYNRISSCESAKEIWDKLEVAHEGTNQVKKSKINLLVQNYEMFKMSSNETISEMFTRFTMIINSMKNLGKTYTNEEMIEKLLRSLPKLWQPKVTAIREAKELSTLSLEQLLGSLVTHEMELAVFDKEDKKKNIALKTSHERDEESESDGDNEMAMITRKFKRFLKKDRNFTRRTPKELEAKKEPIICFKCKKPGHVKADCPLMKKGYKRTKKRAMKATWDDSDGDSSNDDSSEDEVANICLMAHLSEVDSTPDTCCDSQKYDDLQNAFEELHQELENLGAKYISLKKNFSLLSNELNDLKSQNEFLSKENKALNDLKFQNDSLRKEKEELSSLDASSNLLKEENDVLKKQVEDLNITLAKFTLGEQNLNMLLGKQRCVFDKAGLGFNPILKEKKYNNFFENDASTSSNKTQMKSSHQSIFVKGSFSNYSNPNVTCHYCMRKGHFNYKCLNRRKITMVWIEKGTSPPFANKVGPN